MSMAADQRKKRLNTIASSLEQGRAKKKKLGLPKCDLNVRSSISLEWDDKKKSVVAKREQIGLAQRDLSSFIHNVPHCHNILVDVLAVPREIFELDNLNKVLSSEVWQTQLFENERDYLTQFLPKGAETREVVQELLAGDNFHFGNPLLKWGAALCSGTLHPDAVLHQEQCFKANKKAFYSELQKYHNSMIDNLLLWKERWASCKDPEKEVVYKIWRSRKQAERSISIDAHESRFHDAQEDLAATSESGSWDAYDKAGGNDNENVMRKHGELQKRKGFMEDKCDNLPAGLKVVTRLRKGEKLQKRNIQCGDGSKYMSYIKVSSEQHQRVKSSMKHSSTSIQSSSLNLVLGNLYTFHVQPFEVFEEEERKKLQVHWLQLATRDIPVAFANWRRWRMEKWQLSQSLEQEMEDKLSSIKKGEEKENAHGMLPDRTSNRAAANEATITLEVEEKGKSDSLLPEQIDDGAENHKPAIALEGQEKENPNEIVPEMMDDAAAKHEPTLENNQSVGVSKQNQHLQQIPALSGNHVFCPMYLDSDCHVIRERDDIHSTVSEYPENLDSVDIAVSQGDSLSSTGEVWPPVSMPDSYYHSTAPNHEYVSARESSLGHSQVFEEQPARLIDLESDNREGDTGNGLLHRQPADGSFFNPYTDQEVLDRNELLQHYFKGKGGLPYHHEQKQTRLDFQPASNVSMEMGPFSGHFGEQLHPSLPLEPRQKKLNDIYMHQNIQEKLFSDGGRYTIPRQEYFSAANVQDWAVNTTHMSAPLQSDLEGGELGRNWFSGEHRVRDGWSRVDGAVGPTQTIENRSNADQSLFGVLSQCNELRSGAPYDSIGSTEQFIQSGTYVGVGAAVPTAGNVLPQMAHPLDYLSGHDATAPVKNNNIGWMSRPHQNSALQDSMEKPFLRSWNN